MQGLVKAFRAIGLKGRRPWVAFVLGLLSPGLGHLYAGAPARTLAALAVVCVVVLPAMRWAALVLSWSPWAVIGGASLALILGLLVPLDGALVVVRRRRRAAAPWNRAWLCLVYGPAALLLLLLANLWIADHFWLRTFRVPSPSMAPTLLPGDHVLADMRRRATAALGTGDVVVFADAEKPYSFYVKRVAALAGETVELGSARAPLAEPLRTQPEQERLQTLVVPEGHVFVLGDNLSQSIDSRYWGPLPAGRILGRACRIYFSRDPVSGRLRWERMGRTLEGAEGNPGAGNALRPDPADGISPSSASGNRLHGDLGDVSRARVYGIEHMVPTGTEIEQ